MTVALMNNGWYLHGREDAVKTRLKMFKHVWASNSFTDMTEEVPLLRLHMELGSCKGKLVRSFSLLPLIFNRILLFHLF